MEDGLEFRVVLLRVGANEVDDFAVAIGRPFLIASGLVDHSEAIPAVMHIGEARDEVAGGLLGLIELAGLDEVDGGVGRRGQLVLGLVDAGVGGGEAFGDFGVRWAFAPGRWDGRECTRGFLVLGEAQANLADFYREMGDLFGVVLRPHNRWAGAKVLRERWHMTTRLPQKWTPMNQNVWTVS
jgi:hypothetical protein